MREGPAASPQTLRFRKKRLKKLLASRNPPIRLLSISSATSYKKAPFDGAEIPAEPPPPPVSYPESAAPSSPRETTATRPHTTKSAAAPAPNKKKSSVDLLLKTTPSIPPLSFEPSEEDQSSGDCSPSTTQTARQKRRGSRFPTIPQNPKNAAEETTRFHESSNPSAPIHHGDLLELIFGEFSTAQTTADSLDGSQSIGNLAVPIDVGVKNTMNVLELLRNDQRHGVVILLTLLAIEGSLGYQQRSLLLIRADPIGEVAHVPHFGHFDLLRSGEERQQLDTREPP